MKTVIFLFFIVLLYATSSVAGLPPTSLKGQEDASAKTTFFFQTPNKQSTQVSSSTGLIETGNNNILENPSFEHTTYSTGWTQSGGSPALEQTVVIHGKKAYFNTLSAATLSFYQDSTLYQAQFADGVQGLAMIWAKATVSGFFLCARQAGATVLTNCAPINGDSKWGPYKLPFVLRGTSNGLAIVSGTQSNNLVTTGNVTGDITLDGAFVGAVDAAADVDQSRVAGESYFPGTASCTGWTRTSTTLGAFATDADCPGPTVSFSTMGSWQTTDVDLPEQTINNLPAGTYEATFQLPHFVGTSNNSPVLAINDGTTTCTGVRGNGHNSAQIGQTVSCIFRYTESGNRSFELYTATASGTSDLPLSQTSPSVNVKFTLKYFGSSQVYNAPCGANCVDTFSAKIDGTSSDAVSAENIDWLPANCTDATTGESTCTFNPGIFTVAPNCTCTQNTGASAADQTCTFNSLTSTGFTIQTTNNGTLADRVATVSCQKQGADFTATRLIQGQFKEVNTSPGIDRPKLCSFTVAGANATSACSSNPCTIYNEYGDCAASASRSTTGTYNVVLEKWSGRPNCVLKRGNATSLRECRGAADSSTSMDVLCENTATGAGSDAYFEVICHGQAP
jgi:hypothetical protein